MKNLVFPNRVFIQLVDKDLRPLKLVDVIFRVRLLARIKNDFRLQPFSTDFDGRITIDKNEIESEVQANYDSGLMDYSHVSECSPTVEIWLLSEQDIRLALEGRKIWKNLLTGERDRWSSMGQLLSVYKRANNSKLFTDASAPLRVDWDTADAEYSYQFVVFPKW